MATTAPVTGGSPGLGTDLAGIYDLIRGITGGDQAAYGGAANVADPLNKWRGQAGDMLMGLLKDPGSFKFDPGQQFAVEQGQNAISQASNALYGTQRTGSLAPELAKYTEGYANQAFDTRIQELFGIASGNPAAAGALTAAGVDKNQTSLAGGATTLGNLLGGLLGGGSGNNSLLGLIKSLSGSGLGSGSTPSYDSGGSGSAPGPGSVGDLPVPDLSTPIIDNVGSDWSGGGFDWGSVDFSSFS